MLPPLLHAPPAAPAAKEYIHHTRHPTQRPAMMQPSDTSQQGHTAHSPSSRARSQYSGPRHILHMQSCSLKQQQDASVLGIASAQHCNEVSPTKPSGKAAQAPAQAPPASAPAQAPISCAARASTTCTEPCSAPSLRAELRSWRSPSAALHVLCQRCSCNVALRRSRPLAANPARSPAQLSATSCQARPAQRAMPVAGCLFLLSCTGASTSA